MTGHGGWPMTVFLDPDGVPFYGGTYFPPEPAPRHAQLPPGAGGGQPRPARERREEIRDSAPRTSRASSARSGEIEPPTDPLERRHARRGGRRACAARSTGQRRLRRRAEVPARLGLEFLLRPRRADDDALETTLDAMAAGGIYDQLGGGFPRYSVDAAWLVPHFEKMLYDNALLARAYLHGWQVTGHERYRASASETLDWALREMRGPEGGFYSALDADSEGEEGKFYVWTRSRDRGAPRRARRRCDRPPRRHRGAATSRAPTSSTCPAAPPRSRRQGSSRTAPCSIEAALEAGLAGTRRQAPDRLERTDDRALAEAGAVLGRGDYLEAARGCADFVLVRDARRRGASAAHLQGRRSEADRLPRGPRLPARSAADPLRGQLRSALVRRRRARVADALLARFSDSERGGFFTTTADHEQLIARRKELGDHPIPSGNSSAALGLLRLARAERRAPLRERGGRRAAPLRPRGPPPAGGVRPLLRALDFHLARPTSWRSSGTGWTIWRRWRAPPSGPIWCSPADRRTPRYRS